MGLCIFLPEAFHLFLNVLFSYLEFSLQTAGNAFVSDQYLDGVFFHEYVVQTFETMNYIRASSYVKPSCPLDP